jgi:hypothetical protein
MNGVGLLSGSLPGFQWQRRLLIRWEYYAENFLGFVQLATIVILLQALLR